MRVIESCLWYGAIKVKHSLVWLATIKDHFHCLMANQSIDLKDLGVVQVDQLWVDRQWQHMQSAIRQDIAYSPRRFGAVQEKKMHYPVMTEKHVAGRWQVSLKALRRWRLDGEEPVWHKLFRHVRYHEADVLEFEHSSAQHSMRAAENHLRTPSKSLLTEL
jgi:hypothetical protein